MVETWEHEHATDQQNNSTENILFIPFFDMQRWSRRTARNDTTPLPFDCYSVLMDSGEH